MATDAEARPRLKRNLPTAKIPRPNHRHVRISELAADVCIRAAAKENYSSAVPAWRSGNGVGRINEVTLRRARLVLGWVTMSGFDSRRRHGTVFLPTSLHQLFYRLSRDNLKHFYLPNLSLPSL